MKRVLLCVCLLALSAPACQSTETSASPNNNTTGDMRDMSSGTTGRDQGRGEDMPVAVDQGGAGEDGAQSADLGGADMTGAGDMSGTSDMTVADMASPGDMSMSQPDASSAPTCRGYATRYWDCCKAHCGWTGNVPAGVSPVKSCAANDAVLASFDTQSACSGPAPNAAFTCTNMAPFVASPTLSYGFAAVPATGDICGRCYELTFDGSSFNAGNDPGSAALAGKRMIVQATNIGHDVGNGQFDILIPGGGVGAFDACTYQWNHNNLGATYGGFLTECKNNLGGNANHGALKTCLKSKCAAVFQSGSFPNLKAGCDWFVDWFEVADNPALDFREVTCPDALVNVSGVDRRPLNDVQACSGGGGNTGGAGCTQQVKDACDCAWANGGTTCGTDDGSCCWTACCTP